MPFAQLGFSADVPFVDGAQTPLPFDTIVYESAAFGGFELITGLSVFFVPFGAYLVTLQADIDTTPTQLDASVAVSSASGSDASAATSALSAISFPLSAVRFSSEIPIPGHVRPCSILAGVQVTGGGNGNITAQFTKLFVWKLQEFQVAP